MRRRTLAKSLRKGLEERLIKDALPNIARGLGEWLEMQGTDLEDQEQLRRIEEAALTLVFRYMFLLHTEARGYLPIGSAAYRPHSATQLADDSRPERGPFRHEIYPEVGSASDSGSHGSHWRSLRQCACLQR